MSNHTPGPWKVFPEIVFNGVHERHACVGRYNADCAHGIEPIVTCYDKANAARIVACVNACDGIADPSVVPEMLDSLQNLHDQYAGHREFNPECRVCKLLARAEGRK